MRLELDSLSPQSCVTCPRCGLDINLAEHICTSSTSDNELVTEPAVWAVRMRWAIDHGRLTIDQARDMVAHADWLPEHFNARLDALGIPRQIPERELVSAGGGLQARRGYLRRLRNRLGR